jgi:hypothetical protein
MEVYSSIEEYTPATGTWRTLSRALAAARFAHSTTTLLDGSLIIAGGQDNSKVIIPTAELFVRPK